MKPQRGATYTTREVLSLELLDSPHFGFCIDGRRTVIQNSHCSDEELLAQPGMADVRWEYIRTTDEWIPVFRAVDDAAVLAVVDVEPSRYQYDDEGSMWVTPKGLPREQYVHEA